MTTESDNVRTLRSAYEQWASCKGASLDCWVNVVADEVTLKSLADGAPQMPLTQERSGKDGILDYLRGLTDAWEMIHYDVDEYVAQGDRVVAIGSTSWRNRETGKVASTPKVDVWRLKNGRVVAFSEFYDTARIFEAAQP